MKKRQTISSVRDARNPPARVLTLSVPSG